MTVHRKAGTVEDALKNVLGDLSPNEIEAATGKGVSAFYKISLPGRGPELDFREAAELDAALIRRGLQPKFLPLLMEITTATLARLGGGTSPAVEIDAALRHLFIECGELTKATEDAMADGVLDKRERSRVASRAQDVMDCARTIRDAAEPPYEGAATAIHSLRPGASTAA